MLIFGCQTSWRRTSGASNNVIKNCNLSCNAPQNTAALITFGIFSGGSAINITSVGPDNDNNTFSNNYITKVRYGIFSAGGNSANPNSGTVITGNLIGPASFGITQIGKAGIVLYNETGATISQNEIRYVGGDFSNSPTAGNDRVGIASCRGGPAIWPATTIAYVTNTTVSRNLIHHIVNERTFSALGILEAAGYGTNNTGNVISNNMMYNIKANGTSNHQALGIGVYIGKADVFAFNSVYLTGDTDPWASAGTPTVGNFCFSIAGTAPLNLVIEDNIFFMDLTSSSAPLLKNACINIPAVYNWGTGLTNYNDMYVIPGHTQAYVGCRGGGGTAGILYADLAAWRTVSFQDANSISADPQFLSPTDLHINTAFNNVGDKGFPVAGITADIDGDVRNVATPDIGIDEYSYIPTDPTGVVAASGSPDSIGITFINNLDLQNVMIVWNLTGVFTTPAGSPPGVGEPFAGGTVLYNYIISPVNHTGLTPNTTYYYKLFSFDYYSNYSPGVTAQATTAATGFPLSVDVNAGWNMVSIPGLHPTDQNVDTWWPFQSIKFKCIQVCRQLPGSYYCRTW